MIEPALVEIDLKMGKAQMKTEGGNSLAHFPTHYQSLNTCSTLFTERKLEVGSCTA